MIISSAHPGRVLRHALALSAATALCGSFTTSAAATHAPDVSAAAKPPVVVSMGDSFISGEAGRWQGNSLETDEGGLGTDRAYDYTTEGSDPARVYGDTYASGCNRSDSAEIKSASFTVDGVELSDAAAYNIACSGATSSAVLLPENGGTPFKGERSQAEQLAEIAAHNDVRLVVLSLGGNDLGFSDIITACTKEFLKPFGGGPCAGAQGQVVAERLPRMKEAVARTVDDIRTVMADAGQRPESYRLVMQSYPSPLPTAPEVRYPGEKYDRFTAGGCPFFDKDLTWAHDELVPDISRAVREVATDRGADFLDLSRAFDDREVCAAGSSQVTAESQADGSTSEWMRFLTTGAGEGQLQESLHPNYFGQRALGDCLTELAASAPGHHACHNTAGDGPESMILSPAADI